MADNATPSKYNDPQTPSLTADQKAITATPSKYNDPQVRNIFPLPFWKEFYGLLQDRFHALAKMLLFGGRDEFTILLVAVSREIDQRYSREKSPAFIYAGCIKQRELLDAGGKSRWGREPSDLQKHEGAWQTLSDDKATILDEKNTPVATEVYQKIRNGTYSLNDIAAVGSLKDYFAQETLYTEAQKLEKIVLEAYFDIEEDLFVSLPLIGFGELDGMIHIVFKKELLSHVVNYQGNNRIPTEVLKPLLQVFIGTYDDMFLRFDTVGEQLEKISSVRFFMKDTVFKTDEYFNSVIGTGKTKIYKELGLQDYYQKHSAYFLKCLELGEGVPGKIYQQYITNAVTAILIDSYAHNVSAHALSTLSWWYARRAKRLKEEELNWDNVLAALRKSEDIETDAIDRFHDQIKKRRKKRIEASGNRVGEDKPVRREDGYEVINFPGSLSREMSRLLRFLTEKGAYWGGVTRDVSVGGRISSLYAVLWHDFINNPFYIGTIAKTEDILHLKFRIILYDPEKPGDHSLATTFHEKTFHPDNEGIFAEVDLTNPRKETERSEKTMQHEVLSAFVHKGEKFKTLREKLRNIKIFFPGDVVGRHAFYTMIAIMV
jgi:hypothetical protein